MSADNVVGAAEPGQVAEYTPKLAGASSDKVVAVFNPLTADFRVQFSRPLAQPATVSAGLQLARDKAGLDLNKEQGVQGHAVQYHILKAGKTENLPGDIAQIAVNQLVNYILTSRAGKGRPKLVSDPIMRTEVEEEVIISVTDNTAFFNRQTAEEVTEQQVKDLNKPADNPEPPKAKTKPESSKETPDPPPGQGVSY